MPLSVTVASKIGFLAEAILVGAYTLLFVTSAALRHVKQREVSVVMVVMHILLSVCCTTHFFREVDAYLNPDAVDALANPVNAIQKLSVTNLLIALSVFTSECQLLYRCWVVWRGRWLMVILPCLTTIGGLVCSIVAVHLGFTVHGPLGILSPMVVSLNKAGSVLPLCTSVMVTGLLSYRIWKLSKASPHAPPSSLFIKMMTAVNIFYESAALLPIVQLVYAVLVCSNHPAQTILAMLAVQVYGIVPTMIFIQIVLRLTSEYTAQGPLAPFDDSGERGSVYTPGSMGMDDKCLIREDAVIVE